MKPRIHEFPTQSHRKSLQPSRDALSKVMRDMDLLGKHITHGFRGKLRTLARERLSVDIDVSEAKPARAKRGDVQKTKQRMTFVDQCIKVIQTCADCLDKSRIGEHAEHTLDSITQ